MSNVKTVDMTFVAPYDLTFEDIFVFTLGECSKPWFGLNMKVCEPEVVEGEDGFQHLAVRCDITGQEAVSWSWLELHAEALARAGARFAKATIRDIEANEECDWLKKLQTHYQIGEENRRHSRELSKV